MKLLLQKGSHYLHFLPVTFSTSKFNVYYSRPYGEPETDIKFPYEELNKYSISHGWRKVFPGEQFEDISLILVFDQGWDEVEWKPYPIYQGHGAISSKKLSKKSLDELLSSWTLVGPEMMGDHKHSDHQSYHNVYSDHPYYVHAEKQIYSSGVKPIGPKLTLEHQGTDLLKIFGPEDDKYHFVVKHIFDPPEIILTANYKGKTYHGKTWAKGIPQEDIYTLMVLKNKMILEMQAAN